MPDIDKAGREEFLRHFPVSHETLATLDRYAELLFEWNEKFNLVAESTLPHIWRRHFLDSAQLLKLVPDQSRALADLGSGAGFPGLVLSIMGASRMHLVESTGKKAAFLQAVIDELRLTAIVHQARAEDLRDVKFDAVMARALKPLPQLLKLAKSLMKKDSIGLFLKGQKLDAELTESAEYWTFDHEIIPSLSDVSGRVLKISNLKPVPASRKNGARSKTT